MSNTYRRYKADKVQHSKWELIYGTIAARLLRSGKYHIDNAFRVAKFLGSFVYVFSFPYSWVKMLAIRLKIKGGKD